MKRGASANASAFAEAVEGSAEGIEAVPDGIILDDLGPRLVCHCGWHVLSMMRSEKEEAVLQPFDNKIL
jgi:hypothetical protein